LKYHDIKVVFTHSLTYSLTHSLTHSFIGVHIYWYYLDEKLSSSNVR
jgi:hypothetical protein